MLARCLSRPPLPRLALFLSPLSSAGSFPQVPETQEEVDLLLDSNYAIISQLVRLRYMREAGKPSRVERKLMTMLETNLAKLVACQSPAALITPQTAQATRAMMRQAKETEHRQAPAAAPAASQQAQQQLQQSEHHMMQQAAGASSQGAMQMMQGGMGAAMGGGATSGGMQQAAMGGGMMQGMMTHEAMQQQQHMHHHQQQHQRQAVGMHAAQQQAQKQQMQQHHDLQGYPSGLPQ
jgi:hypothetical protein